MAPSKLGSQARNDAGTPSTKFKLDVTTVRAYHVRTECMDVAVAFSDVTFHAIGVEYCLVWFARLDSIADNPSQSVPWLMLNRLQVDGTGRAMTGWGERMRLSGGVILTLLGVAGFLAPVPISAGEITPM